MAGAGKEVADAAKDKAKQAAKNIGKEIGKKIAGMILKNPYFWMVVGIMFIIIIVVGTFIDIDSQAASVSETYGQIPTGWWWPIGSEETITEGNAMFAIGTPVECVITSGVGPRWGTRHNGIDIAPTAGGSPPGPYIISAGMGTVTYVIDGFEDNGSLSNSDGNGFGNHVVIDYGDGITITYGHLSKNTIKVHVGDEVDYGQVIAQMGHSGHSTGMHLHFEMRKDGVVIDPEEYVDPNNPRPMQQVTAMGSSSSSAAKEFVRVAENDAMRQYLSGEITSYNSSPYIYKYITEDKQYYLMGNDLGLNRNGNYGFGVCFYVCSGSVYGVGDMINPSVGIFQNTGYFSDRNYDVRNNSAYHKYYVSKIPVGVVDEIEDEIFQGNRNAIKDRAASYGVTLNDHQLDALTDISYQYGLGGGGISNVLQTLASGGTVTKSTARGFYEYADRGERRWVLFTEGRYLDANGKEIKVSNSGSSKTSNLASATRISRYAQFFGFGGSTDILKVAEKMRSEMEKVGYGYITNTLATTYEKSKQYRSTCCATYVSWVLQECGYISDNEHFDNCAQEERLLQSKGWNRYRVGTTSLQPGDIIVYYGYRSSGSYGGDHYHTDIYVKDGKVLSVGDAVTAATGHYWNMSNTNDYYIYRPPQTTTSGLNSAKTSTGTNGYSSTYTSSITGRTFKEFKQNSSSFTYPSIPSNCSWSSECGTVSTIIVGSGYNSSVTIKTGADLLYSTGGSTSISGYLNTLTKRNTSLTGSSVSTIRSYLKSGYVGVIHNPGYSGSGHFLAILDLSKDGNQVYISNPDVYGANSGGANGATKQGWNNISTVANALDGITWVK